MSDYQVSNDLSESRHLETVEAGVLIPLEQSAITGAFLGLLALLLTVYFGVVDWPIVSLGVWLSGTFFTWLILQRRWLSLTARREYYLPADDDKQKKPDPPAHVVKVNLVADGVGVSQNHKVARLPVDEQTLFLLAVGLLSGRQFSEREWTGSGRPLSVKKFRALRDEMLARGMIEPAGKVATNGYKLTKAGAAVMRHFSPTGGGAGLE
jgi:hypothetical protein